MSRSASLIVSLALFCSVAAAENSAANEKLQQALLDLSQKGLSAAQKEIFLSMVDEGIREGANIHEKMGSAPLATFALAHCDEVVLKRLHAHNGAVFQKRARKTYYLPASGVAMETPSPAELFFIHVPSEPALKAEHNFNYWHRLFTNIRFLRLTLSSDGRAKTLKVIRQVQTETPHSLLMIAAKFFMKNEPFPAVDDAVCLFAKLIESESLQKECLSKNIRPALDTSKSKQCRDRRIAMLLPIIDLFEDESEGEGEEETVEAFGVAPLLLPKTAQRTPAPMLAPPPAEKAVLTPPTPILALPPVEAKTTKQPPAPVRAPLACMDELEDFISSSNFFPVYRHTRRYKNGFDSAVFMGIIEQFDKCTKGTNKQERLRHYRKIRNAITSSIVSDMQRAGTSFDYPSPFDDGPALQRARTSDLEYLRRISSASFKPATEAKEYRVRDFDPKLLKLNMGLDQSGRLAAHLTSLSKIHVFAPAVKNN
jgi:hypothetical protein